MSAEQHFDPEAEQEVDFGRYWRLLAARWWVVAAGLVFGAIVGYAVALGGTQTFKATATIYLGQPYTASGNVALQSLQTNPSIVGTVAHSAAIDGRVAVLCKVKASVFSGGISSQPIAGNIAKNGQNPLVALSVQSSRRLISACSANELATAVVDRISGYADGKISSFRKQISDDESAITAIETGISSPGVAVTDKLLLQVQLRTLQLDEQNAIQLLHQAQAVEKPSIVTPASASRVTARSRRNSVVIGALIGAILGAIVALAWDRVAAAVARRRAV
jgi:3-hydroxymyristoyl/3-hydroxydecanoyl-(acyl carrier protein) dehydratase